MKFMVLLLAFFVGARIAWASPFLVCDPYPAGLSQALMPVSFILTGLSGASLSVPATTNTDGTIQLHYDLSGLGNGTYTVTAAAVNILGEPSGASAPFTFTVGTPTVPTGLRIVP